MLQTNSNQKKFGVTLVEILVTLGVIGVILAIVLPALGAARETARKISCQNNLKQIGLALAQYEAVYQVYPALSGLPNYGRFTHEPIIINVKQFSAFTYIVQYMNDTTIYNSINFSSAKYDQNLFSDVLGDTNSNSTVSSIQLSYLLCPSDKSSPYILSNYRFNMGTERWYTTFSNNTTGPLLSYNYSSAASITDGLSATVVTSEAIGGTRNFSSFDYRRDALFGGLGLPYSADASLLECDSLPTAKIPFFAYSGNSWTVGTLGQTCYNHIAPPNSTFKNCLIAGVDPAPGIIAASSNHSGGVNTLLMDGSVRLITNGVSKSVWRSISTGNGGDLSFFPY